MMWAIIQKASGKICGYTGEGDYKPGKGYAVAALPEGYTEDLADAVVYQDGKLTLDEARLIAHEKDSVRARIKEEARQHIEATNWRLERAREREYLGVVSGLSEVDAVLARRESIRKASNEIEAQLDSLTDVGVVRAFTWTFDEVAFDVPRRMTKKQFLAMFTPEEIAIVTAAAASNPSVKAWMMVFENAELVDLSDPSLQMGIGALEMAGLLKEGRAAEILRR